MALGLELERLNGLAVVTLDDPDLDAEKILHVLRRFVGTAGSEIIELCRHQRPDPGNPVPAEDAFEQTCFLESARQDILIERIAFLNDGIRALVSTPLGYSG